MTIGFKTLMATVGIAALTAACGSAIPTASTPDLSSGDSTGAATALSARPGFLPPQPEGCTSQLSLTKVASSKTSVSLHATWVSNVEKFPASCGSVVWNVSPEAKTIIRRFDPNVITIFGQLGTGYLVTASGAGQRVSMKVAIGD